MYTFAYLLLQLMHNMRRAESEHTPFIKFGSSHNKIFILSSGRAFMAAGLIGGHQEPVSLSRLLLSGSKM